MDGADAQILGVVQRTPLVDEKPRTELVRQRDRLGLAGAEEGERGGTLVGWVGHHVPQVSE
jgi:hypothetical protein